ncbi:hypothetical protein AN639_12010 [Candidatus Epulonipiscium fishelsonii]|uniref:Uncharacterized protein n=1 Tax=Candidatus Epulonipiscium fishelsonii TaxID=77094 RepID=A0ACC8XCI5_9FIRM|nr:hypothetical protein AN396_06055 [Epulopiscium sp. SCG-B11WGA-EpuloA1]ONI42729.1 hypothetical protein AN639_12010 [Epulopiscium sp. SCG-B05WGA-EpuloA1]
MISIKEKHVVVAIFFIALVILPFVLYLHVDVLNYPLDTAFATQGNKTDDFTLFYKGVILKLCTFSLLIILAGKKFIDVHNLKLPEKNKLIIGPIVGYIICVGISFLLSNNMILGILGAPGSYENVFMLLSYGFIFLAGLYYFQDDFYSNTLIKGIDIMLVGLSVMGIVEFFYASITQMEIIQYLITPREYWIYLSTLIQATFSKQISLTFFNPNYASLFLLMLIPINVMKIKQNTGKTKIAYSILFICLMMSFFFTRSTTGFYALIVIAILEIILYYKQIVKGIKYVLGLGLILGLTFVIVNYASGNILFNVFLGDSLQNIGHAAYPVTELRLENNVLFVENEEDTFAIMASYPLNLGTVQVASMQNKSINFEVVQNTLVFKDEFEPIKLTCDGNYLLVDLGYDEPVYFEMTSENKLMALGINGYHLSVINDNSGIGFENHQHIATGRGYIWRKSIPLLKIGGLFGTGPDTTALYIPQNDFAGKLNYHGKVSLILNTPHNMYLQIGINTGLLSLGCLLVLFGYYGIQGLKLLFLDKVAKLSPYYDISVALFLSHVGYFICALAYDSNASTAPFFWITLAMNFAFFNKMNKDCNLCKTL